MLVVVAAKEVAPVKILVLITAVVVVAVVVVVLVAVKEVAPVKILVLTTVSVHGQWVPRTQKLRSPACWKFRAVKRYPIKAR